ncbi:MAG: HD domain-containing phosphohydrolase [Planctomycetota bacterium]
MRPEVVHELVARIERADLSTAAHTWRVVLYARALAEVFGVDRETMSLLTHGAALHDVGKIDIPSRILQKPGPLTEEEFDVIKQHPLLGYARLVTLDVSDEPILNLIRYHHERWDGRGYPYGLGGEEIPIGARFFAVIDTFDALTSVRPYREEVGEEAAERALEILAGDSGSHYWAEAVEAFTKLYRTGQLDYILHHFNDRASLPAYTSGNDDGLDRVRRGKSER